MKKECETCKWRESETGYYSPCPSHTEARQEGGGWRERFDEIVELHINGEDTRQQFGDDAKAFIEAELKAVEERVQRTVESLKHIEIENETREHKIRYSGYNEALDDLLSRLNGNEGETK